MQHIFASLDLDGLCHGLTILTHECGHINYFHILISISANLYLMRILDVFQALRMIQELLETKNIVDSVCSRVKVNLYPDP
jgi:hypothetical protein